MRGFNVLIYEAIWLGIGLTLMLYAIYSFFRKKRNKKE